MITRGLADLAYQFAQLRRIVVADATWRQLKTENKG
jgi:hypothetical protein